MAPSKRRAKPKSLSHGRPTHLKSKLPVSLSSKATRTLIRTHHTLEKQRAKALSSGNAAVAEDILKQIQAQGGIETYQRASLLGQGNERGGDSSRVLMGWLAPILTSGPKEKQAKNASEKGQDQGRNIGKEKKLRFLEVGALSTTNACSKSGFFDIERIDLNSQTEGITQQDFMERPLPSSSTHFQDEAEAEAESDKFDVISLSLVLNYVPDPAARGEMLRRTLRFLRPPFTSLPMADSATGTEMATFFPCLFLVLPAPCVLNSRYLDEARLESIMQSLGYVKLEQKMSNKLSYYLWKATNLVPQKQTKPFKKVEIRAGGSRNNFAVVMK